MLQIVHINGFVWYADVNNKVLYTDREKTSGSPFSFMTENERKQMENELRFPRVTETQEA
jgi:ClpP class serine protease